MYKNILFLIILGLIFLKESHAQDTTDFFPHHLGDIWEYRFFAGYYDILQVKTIVDSTDEQGSTHVTNEAKLLGSDEDVSWAGGVYTIDTLGQVWKHIYGQIRLEYKMDVDKGEMWIVSSYDGGWQIARVEELYEDQLLGILTTLKGIVYYNTTDTTDTTIWLNLRGQLLADGFGVVGVWTHNGPSWNIRGAVIDGVLYGDTTMILGIERNETRNYSGEIKFYQNYPNPFNTQTTFSYELSGRAHVRLIVYDLLGSQVRVLIDGIQNPGIHQVTWDGRNERGNEVSSGVYLYQVETFIGDRYHIWDLRKLVLLR